MLLVAVVYFTVQLNYLPDAINETLKQYIIAAVFLTGLIVLGYVFFAHDGVSSNLTAHLGYTASTANQLTRAASPARNLRLAGESVNYPVV